MKCGYVTGLAWTKRVINEEVLRQMNKNKEVSNHIQCKKLEHRDGHELLHPYSCSVDPTHFPHLPPPSDHHSCPSLLEHSSQERKRRRRKKEKKCKTEKNVLAEKP